MSRTDLTSNASLPGTRQIRTKYYRADGTVRRDFGVGTDVQKSWGQTVSRTGTVTPNFAHLQETGNLPFNRFSFAKIETNHDHGMVYERTQAADEQVETQYSGALGTSFCSDAIRRFSGPTIFNLENLVKMKVLEQLKGMNINLAQAIAERDQTLKLLATAISRIGRSYSALRHGNFRGAAAALGVGSGRNSPGFTFAYARDQQRAIARGWLELQYGWRPLLNDIYGAAQEFEKQLAGTRRQQYVTISRSSKLQDEEVVVRTPFEGGIDTIVFGKNITKKVMVKYKLANPVLTTTAALGLTNPALVAWELVPFSFVVDWMLPIGGYLNALDATLGWTFQDGAITTFEIYTVKANRTASARPGYVKYSANIDFNRTETNCLRGSLGAWGVMPVLPAVKDPASVQHVLNALALLSTHKR